MKYVALVILFGVVAFCGSYYGTTKALIDETPCTAPPPGEEKKAYLLTQEEPGEDEGSRILDVYLHEAEEKIRLVYNTRKTVINSSDDFNVMLRNKRADKHRVVIYCSRDSQSKKASWALVRIQENGFQLISLNADVALIQSEIDELQK